MKNLFKYVFMLMVVAMSAVVISSCGGSDDDDDNNSSGGGSGSSYAGFYVYYAGQDYPDSGMEITSSGTITEYACTDAAHKYSQYTWTKVSGVSDLYRSTKVFWTKQILTATSTQIITTDGDIYRVSGNTIYRGDLPYIKVK